MNFTELLNPDSLLTQTWITLANWKWLALAAGLFICGLLSWIGHRVFDHFRISFRDRWIYNEFLQVFLALEVQKPLTGIAVGLAWRAITDGLGLVGWISGLSNFLVILYLGYHIVHLLFFAAHSVGLLMEAWAKKTTNTLDDQLAPFAGKMLKIAVILIGSLSVVQHLGFNVMSLVAGLGLGGLALALAAQDTAANLFGSITIILDRPFQVGDLVRIGDTLGNIEDVGFRSTGLRTPNNSLVSIPNSVVAKEKIENLGARKSRRFFHTLGLKYETSNAVLNQIIDAVHYLLFQHPLILKQDIQVHLVNFGSSTLDVRISAYVGTLDIETELKVQQELLLEIINIVKGSGSDFAYPTQSLHVVQALKPLS